MLGNDKTTRLRVVQHYYAKTVLHFIFLLFIWSCYVTTGNRHFAECRTRQRALGKKLIGKEAFAECFLSGTRQSLCRVPEKHSAKIYTRQNENAKKPKNNSNFFSGEATTGQRPPVSIEVTAFFAQNSWLTRPAGFELTTSPSRVCCSTTALYYHLCLNSVIYPHILY